MLNNKTLLITGGTGSFGNAVLNRFMYDDRFSEIRIFSRDEKKQDDMRHQLNSPKVRYYIGDVREKRSVDGAMMGVDYVFHAAALKQVPSCEFFPIQAVRTNVLGTENVLDSAIQHGVKNIVALGRSDLFLRIEIIKKLMGIPPILLAIFISIKAMIAGMIVVSLLALLVNTYHTRKLINLGIVEQLSAIRNSLIIGVAIAIIFTPIVYYLNHVNQLLILVTIGILMPLCIYGLLRIFKLDEYREMKSIFDDIKTKYAKR